jgi:hypothetical protein
VNLEVLNSIASVATLLVIAATAVAALGQLRHSRGSNQIVALTECREVLESEAFSGAILFVRRRLPDMLRDPSTRARLQVIPLDPDLRPINIVGNFFESMGSFVKHDIIDEEIACDLWSGIVVAAWDALAPALAIMRRHAGIGLWENFEYLTGIMKAWNARHPDGTFPPNAPRLPVPDVWKEADEAAGVTPRQ